MYIHVRGRLTWLVGILNPCSTKILDGDVKWCLNASTVVVGLLLPFSLLLQQENESRMKKKMPLYLFMLRIPKTGRFFPSWQKKIAKNGQSNTQEKIQENMQTMHGKDGRNSGIKCTYLWEEDCVDWFESWTLAPQKSLMVMVNGVLMPPK